eukprot:jgi/Tetstr1/439302/TSEL_027743.t1
MAQRWQQPQQPASLLLAVQLLVLAAVAPAAAFYKPPDPDNPFSAFVMGGEDASASRYPYLVSIRNNVQPGEDVHHCGGALISPTTVLTAAHCVDDFRGTMPEIHIGRYCQGQCTGALSRYNNFEVAQAKSVFVHPDWQPWNTLTGSDIAVYELTRPAATRPVRVDVRGAFDLRASPELHVVGLGSDETDKLVDILQEATVPYRPLRSCRAAFSFAQSSGQLQQVPPEFSVLDSMICAGGDTAACNGDSGGPLLVKGSRAEDDLVVGIVSYGISCVANSKLILPSIYTRVSSFEWWLYEFLPNSARPQRPPRPPTPSPPPPSPPPPHPPAPPSPIANSSFVFSPGFLCIGDALDWLPNTNEVACRILCLGNFECQVYGHAPPGVCTLRRTCTRKIAFPGAVSGEKKA